MAVSCNFKVFYWAHDIHLWEHTLPLLPLHRFHRPLRHRHPNRHRHYHPPTATPSATGQRLHGSYNLSQLR